MKKLPKTLLAAALVTTVIGCRGLPRQDGASLAILFELERKLPGAGMHLVRPGVVHARWTGEGPVFVDILAIDLRRGDLYFRPILGQDRLDGAPDTWETLDAMARRKGALAAINGDYPLGALNISGFTVLDGAVHLAPNPPVRSGIIIGKDNTVFLGKYDPEKVGSPAYHQAIGGGPMIQRDGAFIWQRDESGLINGERSPFAGNRLDEPQARTAVCLLDGHATLYWIFVEDRPQDRSGVTPQRMGRLLDRLKCRDALLLAGGPYSGMSLHGRLLGEANDLGRPIGSALGLFQNKRPLAGREAEIGS